MRNSHARALVPVWKLWNPRQASSIVSCTRSSAEAGSNVRRRATRSRAARCGIAICSKASCFEGCCVDTNLHFTPDLVALLLQFVELRQHFFAVRIRIHFQVNLLDG